MRKLVFILSLCWVFYGCNDSDELIVDNSYTFITPENFPEPTYTFNNNEVTREGFLLGRRIFFDPILSRDSTVSCVTCHVQAVAFADPQHRKSIGIDDQVGIRNAPQIANLAFMKNFFWDGGVVHVDFIPLNAIENPVEMDESTGNVIEKMKNHPEYPALFGDAFGTDSVSTPRLQHALSQFMTMMVSANSRYDKYIRNESEELTQVELDGLALFKANCGSCHAGELFTDESFRNNGLDEEFSDPGRGRITEKETDNGKFRVPSLRNVGLTAPYMHDGRFSTLEEVMKHYTEDVKDSETLDAMLKVNDGQLGIALDEEEKTKIIAFLKTLTDREFIQDERFRMPR